MILRCLRFSTRAIWLAACAVGGVLSMVLVLSLVATVPVLQFASLGYMLECSGRVARGLPLRTCFPGFPRFGQCVRCGLWVFLTWLPIWFLTDLGYSSELIQPGSIQAARLRGIARVLSILWVLWVAWAIARGGKWHQFLWPQPIRFVRTILRFGFWRDLEDRWWRFLTGLHLWRLIKLGFKASLGALIWLGLPALAILVALNGSSDASPAQQGALGLLGLLGALSMAWVLQYLPVLQILLASQPLPSEQKFALMWRRDAVRQVFRRVPWTFTLTHLLFFALALPLYPLRIEEIPQQLWFALSIVFVLAMFPAKLLIGWGVRRSNRVSRDMHWFWRWLAWIPMMAAIAIYVGFLYLGKFTLWQGGISVLLQHAFLPPVPFYLE